MNFKFIDEEKKYADIKQQIKAQLAQTTKRKPIFIFAYKKSSLHQSLKKDLDLRKILSLEPDTPFKQDQTVYILNDDDLTQIVLEQR